MLQGGDRRVAYSPSADLLVERANGFIQMGVKDDRTVSLIGRNYTQTNGVYWKNRTGFQDHKVVHKFLKFRISTKSGQPVFKTLTIMKKKPFNTSLLLHRSIIGNSS
jgi:hypothetical protein